MTSVRDKGRLHKLEMTGQDIVVYILFLCLAEVTFDDLVRLMTSTSSTRLKKYLFYLIDYDLISYSGHKQVYIIKSKGLQVLSKLMADKKII
jgi:hypothetical protein